MFACLNISPIPAKSRRKMAPPPLERVEVPGGAPFFRLEAKTFRGQLDWNAIEQAAGRLRTKMLFPDGVQPPALLEASSQARAQLEPGVRAFVPRRLPLLLCLRMAQQALRESHVPARNISVTFVDQKGMLCRGMESFVPLAGSLRVFTPEPALYRSTAAQLLARYGVTLIVSDSPACFAQSDVVVADDLSMFTGRERGIVFTPDGKCLPELRVLRGVGLQLPAPYDKLCPPGIDPLAFACAMYELCGLKEMERLTYAHYAFDGVSEAYALPKISAMIDELPLTLRAQ